MNPDWQIPSCKIQSFKSKTNSYCLCIPIINEGEKFQKQLERVAPYAKMIDILICDGGSTDGSIDADFLEKNNVTTLLVKTSAGKLSTQLRMGYSYALEQGYEGIITIDGNGKDGVEAIPTFIEELKNGYDYVQGSRYQKGGKAINTPFIRHIANHYLHAPLLSCAAKYPFTDTTNGFRAYSKNYLLDPRVKPFRNIFVRYELLAYLTVRASQIGLKVKEIGVTRQYPLGTVPTKINMISGNLDLLVTLFKTVIGAYNPS